VTAAAAVMLRKPHSACTTSAYVSIRQHTPAYVSIRQHTPAYASIRQHTSAYVSIRQHTCESHTAHAPRPRPPSRHTHAPPARRHCCAAPRPAAHLSPPCKPHARSLAAPQHASIR
jgi:hypothetical protein